MTEVQPADLAITYRSSEEEGMVIQGSMEYAEITIRHDLTPDGAVHATTLVSALPEIMNTVAEAIDNQEEA